MIWIALLVISLLVYGIVSIIKGRHKEPDSSVSGAYHSLFAVFIFAILFMIVGNLMFSIPQSWVSWDNTPIVSQQLYSLSTETGVSGQFFLGSGTLKNTAVYYYYQPNSDGTYSLENQDASSCVIRETAGTPELKQFRPTTLFILFAGMPSHDKYEFDIPQGSILNSYNPNVN